MPKESKTYPTLPKMPIDQTLRGKYAESAMKGLISSGYNATYDYRDGLIKAAFDIADRMIEEEFKK